MRGKHRGRRGLLLLLAALLGAGAAGAESAPPAGLPTAVVVVDGSKSMNDKLGGTAKTAAVRAALGEALAAYRDRLSFGLVAFGHRKASNCADSEIVAKPGALTAETQDTLLDKIKSKGQAPIAAALSDAAKGATAKDKLDIVLIADGGDTCDADICSAALAMKEKSPGLRLHVVGFGDKEEDLKPLVCLAGATGGTFAAAANAEGLKGALAKTFDAVLGPAPAPPPQPATSAQDAVQPEATAALPPGVVAMQPVDLGLGPPQAPEQAAPQPQPQQQSQAPAPQPAPQPQQQSQAPAPQPAPQPQQQGQAPAPQPAPPGAGETAVHKSASPPQIAALPSAPPTAALPPAPAAKPQVKSTTAQVQLPVPVTFKALVSEAGPRLQAGITWRVYEATPLPGGANYKLLSTHRDPTPTAALLPGEYLVNAAYGLSNLTKKIKVESGRSIEETFVLNTGGLKLAALLPDGAPLPASAARYDILSDEEDQFGNRQMVLRNAKPGIVIRLNAGAYRIECLYGDANAVAKADITVEPGKVTEATLNQTGAKTTFKLVQSLGGEALADTKWTLLTSAGDVVKENAGALPTHILAPGSYAVVADHAGESFTRKFSIEPGAPKQIEVVIEDGPTSPEELKALTDPPETPPPPPTGGPGVVAGDGTSPSPNAGAAFDSFSPNVPADPNAPLINPGILLRGGGSR
ncbi:MAG: VWA domain-containing protein [Methyloceanibacter sp.]